MIIGHAISPGVAQFLSGGGTVDPPEVEDSPVPTGSDRWDIVTINNVPLSQFRRVVAEFENMAYTGTPTSPKFGMRVSINGGSTFDNTNYIMATCAAAGQPAVDYTGSTFARLHGDPTSNNNADALCFIEGIGLTDTPVTINSVAMSPFGTNTQRFYSTIADPGGAVDALQFGIFVDAGTPVLSGGTFRVIGFY